MYHLRIYILSTCWKSSPWYWNSLLVREIQLLCWRPTDGKVISIHWVSSYHTHTTVSQRTWWRGHLSPFTQHHDLTTKLIWSTIKEDCIRFFIYYLTFYSFVLLHVLNGVLTKPYVATVTNLTRICAKTENMIVCRTYIIRCNIRDVHVKMRWWISSNP